MTDASAEPSRAVPSRAEHSYSEPSCPEPSCPEPSCSEHSRGPDGREVVRPMESTRIVLGDAAALADLQLHWGSAYVIGLDGDIWSATFRGTADELRAHTYLELRTLIRADYAYRQQAGLDRPTGHGDRMSM